MQDDDETDTGDALAEFDALIKNINTLRKDSGTPKESAVDSLKKKVEGIEKYLDDLYPDGWDDENDPEGSNQLWKKNQQIGKEKHIEIIDILRTHLDMLEHGAKQRNVGEYDDDEDEADNETARLDGEYRKIIRNSEKMLRMVDTYFGWRTTNFEWEDVLNNIEVFMSQEIDGLDSIIGAMNPFDGPGPSDNYAPEEDNQPNIYVMLKSIIYHSLRSIYGDLSDLISYQKEINNIEKVEDLFGTELDVNSVASAGITLVEHSKVLAGFDYPMSQEESEDINDLLNVLTNSLRTYAATLESLSIGEGKYKPKLLDVDSHMVTNEYRPRQTYKNMGMWPMETVKEWESMEDYDVINWLGTEQEKQSMNVPGFLHRILYRDFVDFIQSIGYVYKKVAGYRGPQRSRPNLTVFDWNGESRKYRPNATIYFYNPNCQIAGNEMRIVINSFGGEKAGSMTCTTSIEMFRAGTTNDEMETEEKELEIRYKCGEFLIELFSQFEIFQSNHGLLKNSKFNAVCEELNLKGRTFDDIVMSKSKKKLLDENIFAILSNSDRLIARGVETNRGIMLAGPPGVGKSHTIDAIISKSDCTVLYADFVMLRQEMELIFHLARKYSPTILILEDIDALGITSQRGTYSSGAGLSTLLNHMDGIETNNGVITIATSNHPELMDWALVARPGRFDARIDYPFPDHDTLAGILKLKLKKFPCQKNIDLKSLVKKMPWGFTGSHIHDIVNQANYICIQKSDIDPKKMKITQESLDSAMNRSLYNFNKFLSERPGTRLEDLPGAIDVLDDNSDADGRGNLFG